jgi:hypothetical protein
MKQKKVNKLKPGLYRVTWKDDSEYPAVDYGGSNPLFCVLGQISVWHIPSSGKLHETICDIWPYIKRVELIPLSELVSQAGNGTGESNPCAKAWVVRYADSVEDEFESESSAKTACTLLEACGVRPVYMGRKGEILKKVMFMRTRELDLTSRIDDGGDLIPLSDIGKRGDPEEWVVEWEGIQRTFANEDAATTATGLLNACGINGVTYRRNKPEGGMIFASPDGLKVVGKTKSSEAECFDRDKIPQKPYYVVRAKENPAPFGCLCRYEGAESAFMTLMGMINPSVSEVVKVYPNGDYAPVPASSMVIGSPVSHEDEAPREGCSIRPKYGSTKWELCEAHIAADSVKPIHIKPAATIKPGQIVAAKITQSGHFATAPMVNENPSCVQQARDMLERMFDGWHETDTPNWQSLRPSDVVELANLITDKARLEKEVTIAMRLHSSMIDDNARQATRVKLESLTSDKLKLMEELKEASEANKRLEALIATQDAELKDLREETEATKDDLTHKITLKQPTDPLFCSFTDAYPPGTEIISKAESDERLAELRALAKRNKQTITAHGKRIGEQDVKIRRQKESLIAAGKRIKNQRDELARLTLLASGYKTISENPGKNTILRPDEAFTLMNDDFCSISQSLRKGILDCVKEVKAAGRTQITIRCTESEYNLPGMIKDSMRQWSTYIHGDMASMGMGKDDVIISWAGQGGAVETGAEPDLIVQSASDWHLRKKQDGLAHNSKGMQSLKDHAFALGSI